jgi:hypothetical protein
MGLSLNFPRQRRIVGGVVFYTVRDVSKVSLWVCLCIPVSLLGNGRVNTFPRQGRIIGDVFYTVRDVSKESLWVWLCIPVSLLGNGRVNTFPRQGRILGDVFYTVRDVSKDSLWVCLCIPVSLLGNGRVNTFPRQRRILGGVVFYTVRDVSKESKRFVSLSVTLTLASHQCSSRLMCSSSKWRRMQPRVYRTCILHVHGTL